MSEKRFSLVGSKSKFNEILVKVYDNFEEEVIEKQKVVDLLNKLVKDNEELGISIKLFEDDVQIKDKKIEEQQATIRRLQDLCGESDGENAKLRIENKKLKDDLHNCKFNKNIIGEQLKLWQDTLAEYNIYTIKDFEESFKLDAKINKEKDEKIKELEVKVLNLELELMKNVKQKR